MLGIGYLLLIFLKNMEFTKKQNEVWKILFNRQLPLVKRHASSLYMKGFELLKMTSHRIPTLEELNEQVFTRTGWTVVRTNVRYSTAADWYPRFAKREFMVTDYMRSIHELDFTPEPDMFHDIFGHLPFLTLPEYTRVIELFAPAYLRATTDEQREDVKRLAWFSYEFGLIIEQGKIKSLGAGLISSRAELLRVSKGMVPVKLFTRKNVCQREKAVWSFNEELFVADSLEGLRGELEKCFSTW
jgi:phenylalanine-4-hydroxylase